MIDWPNAAEPVGEGLGLHVFFLGHDLAESLWLLQFPRRLVSLDGGEVVPGFPDLGLLCQQELVDIIRVGRGFLFLREEPLASRC